VTELLRAAGEAGSNNAARISYHFKLADAKIVALKIG